MTNESFNERLVGEMFIAYVSNNSVQPSQIGDVVRAISRALSRDNSEELAARGDPAVPIDESITPDYVTCLEDGKQFKSLKRHLGLHGMTPDEYRIRWGLPDDYPMVAPKYAKTRSRLAKKIGLGRKRSAA
jgi:MucR family transcriptional regulator, transcriptional regulator of exopolysaccharide biosynthesis